MRISLVMTFKLAFVAALLAGSVLAQEPEYGPAKGTLIIQGGGSDAGTGIFETFINKAGGLGANIVVVPTAGGNKNPDGSWKVYTEEQSLAMWRRRGATNVHMLHTHDPKVADTEEFAKVLRDANAVWFDGGRQWNIVDSYANTLTLREFHKVLERGGVIGGSSAGATIQGDYLVRGAIAGSEIVMTPEPEHEHGFAFLRKVAIDQHINTRNRWDDIIPVIKKYPNMLGIGLSEGTAIVVTGDRFQVIGKWKVAVHDNTRIYQPWEKPYYVLSIGDVYNMKTRTIEKYGTGVMNSAVIQAK
jgi:cyanophycinase